MEWSIGWPPVLLLPRSPYLIPVDVCDKSYNVKHHEIHINGKRHKRSKGTSQRQKVSRQKSTILRKNKQENLTCKPTYGNRAIRYAKNERRVNSFQVIVRKSVRVFRQDPSGT
ncbi:hypothetical protein CEXT_225951 [Caerostris extrusa]|uniref:Uncharacterized protein n=1 Tax=Caerostris extrusa TaxID=172846 RepID=A0AAV4XY13_CAEEX|nr:hypothetical protein CEXT_225951 [Caerostris extrusa]